MKRGQPFNPYRLFYGAFVPNILLRLKEVTSTEKLFYARLCQFAGKDGECYPSYTLMSEELGITRTQAFNVAQSLVQKEFILIENIKGKQNHYKFLWHPVFEEGAREPWHIVMVDEKDYSNNLNSDPIHCSNGFEYPVQMGLNSTVQMGLNGSYIISKENHKEKYGPDSWPTRLSVYLLDCILERKPDYKKPNLKKWATEIDKMIRLDERDPERVKEVIEWCQKDSFWQDNILSTEKLREQFDKLELKMRKEDKDVRTREDNPFTQPSLEAYRRLKKAKDREAKNDSEPAPGLSRVEAGSSKDGR